jgi:hypothetical protein
MRLYSDPPLGLRLFAVSKSAGSGDIGNQVAINQMLFAPTWLPREINLRFRGDDDDDISQDSLLRYDMGSTVCNLSYCNKPQ